MVMIICVMGTRAKLRGADAFVRDEKAGHPDKTAINHVFRPCRNVLND